MGAKVLLVDDEAHVLRLMKMGLQRAGYDILTARNGEEGLHQFGDKQPDVMIADVDMPRMTGVELCDAIREQYPDTRCKIFISTSRAETELRAWAKECGDIQFLEKPISIRTLTVELEAFFKAANDGDLPS